MPTQPDPNKMRTGKRGRPGRLNDPEYAKLVALWFAEGATYEDMAEEFGVSVWSIGQWRRDPRVKVHTDKIIEDRILKITRRVDFEIAKRLGNATKMSVKDLLDIRREFLGGALRQKTEKVDEETVNQGMQALEEDPELIEEFGKLLERAQGSTNADHDIEG